MGDSCVELRCRQHCEPPWPNGQGAPLLRVRLGVRVPLGVTIFFRELVAVTKKNTPCGTQTHNLQIRSLTRCSVAPTGRARNRPRNKEVSAIFFLPKKKKKKKKKKK